MLDTTRIELTRHALERFRGRIRAGATKGEVLAAAREAEFADGKLARSAVRYGDRWARRGHQGPGPLGKAPRWDSPVLVNRRLGALFVCVADGPGRLAVTTVFRLRDVLEMKARLAATPKRKRGRG